MARTKEEIISEYIENASDDDIIWLGEILDSWNGFLGDDLMSEDWEEFFSIYFSDPMEAARATFFGDIQSWNDEYIGFNAYGNLVSRSRSEYADRIKGYDLVEEIIDNLDNIYDGLPRELQDELEANEDDDEGSYNKKPAKKKAVKKPVKKSPAKKTVKKAPVKKKSPASKKSLPKRNSKGQFVKRK